jgi:predicted exporter
VVSQAAPLEPPSGLDTLSTGQLESLNRLFGQYRVSAMLLSVIGLSLVGLSVFVLYGIRRGIRVFSIPVGACFCSLGLLGLAGQTLNLFHLLGAFLGVCLSHNYAIFSTENSLRGEGAPPSIRLSAITTALSFGVLSLSQIPVVAALGCSVSLIVVFALLIVELEPFLPCFAPDGGHSALRLEPGAKIARKGGSNVFG